MQLDPVFTIEVLKAESFDRIRDFVTESYKNPKPIDQYFNELHQLVCKELDMVSIEEMLNRR